MIFSVNVFSYMLAAQVERGPYADLAAFLDKLGKCPFTGHVERAMWGGFHADRLGYAFAAGYGAALSRLFEHAARVQGLSGPKSLPDPLPKGVACLAVTEVGGVHPRAMTTRLDKEGGALVLRGKKTFATLAPLASDIFVVASRGIAADGTNRLRMVRVRPKMRGVTITPRDAMPFAPEIPHAVIALDNVVVGDADVLAGDGYTHYVKPFRTIEDTHVLAASVAYLVGVSRRYAFDREIIAELMSLGLSLVDVGARDPLAPLTHLALAGLFASAMRLFQALETEWSKASDEERARWERDRTLFSVTRAVRTKRLEVATQALSSSRGLPTP